MRFPKPYFRTQRKLWYVCLDGKRINLGPDEDAALREYGRLIAGRQPIRELQTCVEAIYRYLGWLKAKRARSTYTGRRWFLRHFAAAIGDKLGFNELTHDHVTDWVDAQFAGRSANHQRNAYRAVVACFAWAAKKNKTVSPIAGIEKPAAEERKGVIDARDWGLLMRSLNNRTQKPLRDVLTLMRETGCRPAEARLVEWRWIDQRTKCIEFPDSDDVPVKQRGRLIPLTDAAFKLLKDAAKRYPAGPVLRTFYGRPWTMKMLARRVHKATEELGLDFSAYLIRHTWSTDALERGVDPAAVASIMGHKSLTQLMRTYQKLSERRAYLRRSLDKANGN